MTALAAPCTCGDPYGNHARPGGRCLTFPGCHCQRFHATEECPGAGHLPKLEGVPVCPACNRLAWLRPDGSVMSHEP